jgi:hypothetical protein
MLRRLFKPSIHKTKKNQCLVVPLTFIWNAAPPLLQHNITHRMYHTHTSTCSWCLRLVVPCCQACSAVSRASRRERSCSPLPAVCVYVCVCVCVCVYLCKSMYARFTCISRVGQNRMYTLYIYGWWFLCQT